MYGLVSIVCLIAIVAWVADQTRRDVEHIRRNWHRQRHRRDPWNLTLRLSSVLRLRPAPSTSLLPASLN
jgi:hypothetical protein